MSEPMTDIDTIMATLEAEGLNPRRSAQGGELFERLIDFTIRDTGYHIDWWANISYLTIGGRYGNYIPFTTMTRDECWPGYRRGLKFWHRSEYVACVAIEQLDWQKAKAEQVTP